MEILLKVKGFGAQGLGSGVYGSGQGLGFRQNILHGFEYRLAWELWSRRTLRSPAFGRCFPPSLNCAAHLDTSQRPHRHNKLQNYNSYFGAPQIPDLHS